MTEIKPELHGFEKPLKVNRPNQALRTEITHPYKDDKEAYEVLKKELYQEYTKKPNQAGSVPPEFDETNTSFKNPRKLPIESKTKTEEVKPNPWERFKQWLFWNPERIQEAHVLTEKVNQYVSRYGCKPLPFDKSRIKLHTPFNKLLPTNLLKGTILLGRLYPLSGKLGINMLTDFPNVFVHELLHRHEASFIKKLDPRAFEDSLYVGDLERFGPEMRVKPITENSFGSPYAFTFLHEAIIDRVTDKILRIKPEESITAYGVLKTMYLSVVEVIGKYQERTGKPMDRQSIEEAFEKAAFGQGHALDMARLIDKAYKDIGGLPKFAEKMMIMTGKGIKQNELSRDAFKFITRSGNYQIERSPIRYNNTSKAQFAPSNA